VIYDLHSHTQASDGLLTPEDLVHRPHEMLVGTLAITDHDTTEAIAAARAEIARSELPLTLIAGVEISTVWENHEIHIVGLNIDIENPAMRTFLDEQKARRELRAELIAERLDKAHIPGAWEGALRLAKGGAVTRAHFARFLVEAGKANNIADVFKKYLARGKTGYVPPQWCTIEQAIDVIHHSGGKAERAPNERSQLAEYARQYGLLGSQGSDFHQPCPWIELGRKLWLPAGVEPVWQLWEQPTPIEEREV